MIRPKVSIQLDYECELTIVIGKGGRHIPEAKALDHVFGYTLFNDVSVRDFQRKGAQWTPGKNFDGTGPLGPVVVTADELPPGASGLRIQTRVNGEVMQDSNTSDMIFSTARIIAILSEFMTLEAGRPHRHRHAVRRCAREEAAGVDESRRQGRGGSREDRRARKPDRRRGVSPASAFCDHVPGHSPGTCGLRQIRPSIVAAHHGKECGKPVALRPAAPAASLRDRSRMPKKLIIDGTEIEVEDGITLIQACEQAGVEIPRFCYHERLSIAGNCRMCLVEVVGMPKPQASCALGVNDLPPNRDGTPKVINTRSPMVKKAREGVMEFLLINHPLDCPICDQGGECDLQDQAMAFGKGGTRYHENKRAVDEKYLGPLIKTMMTRCIQCTRCVRFMTEVAGVEELGAIGRGEDMEITTYLEQGMMSELSANVVDLCPVGALTHRPWAFNARPWEMRKTESIDVMDALGAAIRVDTRGREVMRILPRNNDAVNEEWITDKSRHVADGLRTQRLDQPYLRRSGRLEPATWAEALSVVAGKLKSTPPERIGAIAGDLAGAEEMFALKSLLAARGVTNLDCRQDGAKLDPALGRASYLFNATIEGIEQADAILLIGTNPRVESAVLNGRIRKRWRQGGISIGLVGEAADLTYGCDHLGTGPDTLQEIAEGKNAFAGVLRQAQHPLIIVGMGAAARPDGAAVLALAAKIALDANAGKTAGWNAFNILHTAAARVAGLDLGFVPGKDGLDVAGMMAAASEGRLDVLYLLGADEIDMSQARQRLRDLPGQPRRCRRPPRRRHPAGRRLHREGRDLRQSRGPRPDDRQGRVPAGRGARGLDDPAPAFSADGCDAAVRHDRRASHPDGQGGAGARGSRHGDAGRDERRRAPRRAQGKTRHRAVRGIGTRLLHDQSDRPRLGDHGRAVGHQGGRRPHTRGGGIRRVNDACFRRPSTPGGTMRCGSR